MIRIAQPIIGPEEEAAVLRALRSGQLAQGPLVAEFEASFARYVGARHAVAVSSGTAALVVALQAHGIGDGDEVLVPSFTFAATANAVLLAGGQAVLVDIRDDDFNIDPERIEDAITGRTKATLPVHLYGHPADMTALRQVAADRGLVVIEDACQAIGAIALLLALIAQQARAMRHLVVVRGDHAALAGRDALRSVERKARRALRADHAPLPRRTDRLAGVLDHDEAAVRGEPSYRGEIDRVAVEVDGQDRLRSPGDRVLDTLWINIEIVDSYVHKSRPHAREQHGVRRGREGERRHQHLVAIPDAVGL